MYKLHGKRYAYRFNIEEIKGMNLNQSDLLPETHQSSVSLQSPSTVIFSKSKIKNSIKEKKKDESLMELAN